MIMTAQNDRWVSSQLASRLYSSPEKKENIIFGLLFLLLAVLTKNFMGNDTHFNIKYHTS